MRHPLTLAIGLLCGVLLAAGATSAQGGSAQAKSTKPKEERVHGTVRLMDKAANSITVRVQGQQIERQVIYNDSTKFTVRNKPAKLDDLKDRARVIVLGTMNDKKQLVASRIDIRDEPR